ncbi:hypothetical protein HY772_07450 [Candidatus Woesearchaeota archaeon]|nr:hypothetical protein [Candidatus Woesearchaeota archaeon]
MIQQSLVAYIITQLQAGQTIEAINNFLINSGYDRAEVESSIQYVINLQQNPQLAANQRIQQLSYYIQQQQRAGYPLNTIKEFLVSKGYLYYEVDSAINLVTAPAKEIHAEHKLVVFALIAIIVMSGVMSFFYVKMFVLAAKPSEATALLDVKVNKLTTIPIPGEDFIFTTDVINFGKLQPYDITLRYRILRKETDQTILEQQETVAIATTTQRVVTFLLPEDITPGEYVLRTDALYGNYTATSGFIFTIEPEQIAKQKLEEIRKKVPIVEEKKPNITAQTPPTEAPKPILLPLKPAQPLAQPTPPKPAGPFEGKTKEEAFEIVKQMAVREPNRAAGLCQTFDFESNVAQCITMLATFKTQGNFCEFINGTRGKDSCYLQVVLQTRDAQYCSRITIEQAKNSCKLMGLANSVPALAQSGQQQDIYTLFGGIGLSKFSAENATAENSTAQTPT